MPPADIPARWRRAPQNRWAFNHVPEILPTATAAPGTPAPLPACPVSFEDFVVPALRGRKLSLAEFLAATATDAILILQDGQVVLEHYAEEAAPDRPHILMSATKSVTGLVAGILAGAGRLAIDGLVTDVLPELAGTAYRGATLRHLLDMRCGVALDDAAQRAYAAAANWDPVPPGTEPDNLHDFYRGLAVPHHPHGGPFRYVSANTDLLGWVMERATGERFATLLERLLWRPMGAESPAHVTLDRAGAPRCTGGVCATVRDFARLGQLVVEGGRGIIPAGWIADMETGGDHEAWRQGDFSAGAFSRLRMKYRSGWYVIDEEPRILFAMGIHGQNLFIDRANRLVIAKLSSQDNPIDAEAIGLTHRFLPAVRRYLVG
ncbi:beta-lactamase family protein [Belnapia sp. T6]|uniref:Beta-lactamase family protein n=1 Tax=Belnapia mucosa TaxID=2804532 RepID=A0ABS1VDP2_9PROT|nr:serine hydrolase domain-containing protein [Belnapia mucosa]MBL6458528.1 beta-lactamase family protein [Belnapia mucosa]